MSKKLILCFISFVFFSLFNLAHADVVINEVELSPTAERFIELYNTGDSSVDLTGWYMQRKTATGSTFGSLVSSTNFEGKVIDAHDYFVISRSVMDNSDIVLSSLTLTESNTIQIKNGSQDVVDKVGWGDGCDGACVSNPPEGKSIQKDGGSWVSGSPTPGEVNEAGTDSQSSNNNEEENVSNTHTNTSTEPKTKVIVAPIMKAKISASTLAFAGQPFPVDANIYGYTNEDVVLGRLYWNFGDGDAVEQINNFEQFYHTYYYPGEYAVFLEYFLKNSSIVPEITNKMIIKVLPTTVTISKVGDAGDFFIELSNNASSDIDISNWTINANGKIFSLPKNSVIMKKGHMMVSSKITGFTYEDRHNLKLFSSTGELVFDYGVPVVRAKVAVQPKSSTTSKSSESTDTASEEFSDSNLQASAIASDVSKDDPMRSYFLTTIMTVFIGGSAISVYFIRRKKPVLGEGDDFKILDE